MTRQQAASIRRAVKSIGAQCRVVTVGAGRHVDAALEGRDAAAIARQLDARGYTRGTSFGNEIIFRVAP